MTAMHGATGRDAGQRILSTATDLFTRFGYNGVSTRDIASTAHVNEVTVYRHYPRKRDLYVAAVESVLQRIHLRGDLLAGIAEAPDGRAALARTFDLLAQTLIHNPEVLRLMQYSALELNEDFDPLVRKHLGEIVEVIARYLEPWIQRGEVRCSNAKTAVLSLIGIVISHDTLQRMFLGEKLGSERMFEACAAFMIYERAGPEEARTDLHLTALRAELARSEGLQAAG
jgi:AcrR family transcriptional regulator